MSEVDTEKRHWKCQKCGDVVTPHNYVRNKNNDCPKGGKCKWKIVQQSWDNSALGTTVNIGAGIVRWGARKASERRSSDTNEESNHSNQLSNEEQLRMQQERDARSKEDMKGLILLLKKYWWIALILLGLIGSRIIYLRLKHKSPNKVEFPTAINTTNETINNANDSQITKNEEDHSNNSAKQKDTGLEGSWNGSFGKDELIIVIESVDANGAVKGYDEVKGNRRSLLGNLIENETLILTEPGDDKWDGEFRIEIDKIDNKLKGKWHSNNGKIEKDFELIKIK